MVGFGSMGCMGPARVEPIQEIGPNETAFLIPMEGASKDGQAKFMSEEFLQANKVAGKRVILPVRERSTGRMWWDYEYIPTVKVITVDRTPITREWTGDAKTGTGTKNEGIAVESKESIGFTCGVTITAAITEDDAAAYLYWYSTKPLAEVIDQNVRGYIQSYLANEFGNKTLDQCRTDKTAVMSALAEKTKEEFKKRGVTILNVGGSEGLTYESKDVQVSIDSAYSASRKLEQARVDADKAKTEAEGRANAAIETARGNAESAVKWAEGQAKARLVVAEAEKKANEMLNASITPNILMWRGIDKWVGAVPTTLMYGGGADMPAIPVLDVSAKVPNL